MKCKLPERELTEAEQKRREQSGIRANDAIFNHVGRLINISLHKNAGFGISRFKRFNDGSYDIGRYYIEEYSSDDDKDAEEYAVDSYYALRRDLRAFGWDADKELWTDSVFDSFQRTRGLSLRQREELKNYIGYAKTISFYVREMICMSAMELHDTFGFGVERLNRVMHPVRDRYLKLMRILIRDKSDRTAYKAELKGVLDEFNDMKIFTPEQL